MLVTAAALVVVGIWGGITLGRQAEIAERHLGLFASERIVTAGDVIQLRKRGGGDDHRITAHYRYLARGRELTGETTLRRDERDRYAVGSPIAVWYLATEPEASWLDGYAPRPAAELAGDSRAARMRGVCARAHSGGAPSVESARLRAAGYGDGDEGREEEAPTRGRSGWCTTSGPR